jgi:putative membrane-bound dehydrogenase-like protein
MRLLLCLLMSVGLRAFAAPPAPISKDWRVQISLFAAEPDIVTPVGAAVDKSGRLFVVESHTHFPKPNYPGPKSDQIKIFTDADKDGRPDSITVFADGFRSSMNLRFAPDGELYLVHRNGVVILHDRDHDGKCEAKTKVVEMITTGDYPHNGLGGIAFSEDGWLYIGMGENLGASYTLKGSDGSSHSGGGEGGNAFRCRPDGSKLQHVATGFWNAFALEFNRAGYLFCADNDPDSRPPCRLIDVVMGGDYGYKFRYGRSGLHPFSAWNGEIPGTLPMVAGTGEAPSAVLDCDRTRLPVAYAGALLVTSWGDHTLEIYRPKPVGASLRGEREVLIEGTEMFRPVALATAPDGTVYVTDWVDRDYSVHGKGRIWRVAASAAVENLRERERSREPSPERERLNHLLESSSTGELFHALEDTDPFIRSVAVHALTSFKDEVMRRLDDSSANVRLGCALALRRLKTTLPRERFSKLLSDSDEQVRRIALLWIGEEKLEQLAPEIDKAIAGNNVSPALFRTFLATKEALAAKGNLTNMQVFAFAPQRDERKAIQTLKQPREKTPLSLRLDAVRALVDLNTAPEVLLDLALDKKNESQLRAEAIVGLSAQPPSFRERLVPLLTDSSRPVQDSSRVVQLEAVRCLQPIAQEPKVLQALGEAMGSVCEEIGEPVPASQRLLRQIMFVLKEKSSSSLWQYRVVDGDPESGRRMFFNASAGCARCHRIEDFGGNIGPDLSVISRASDRKKILESILEPSKEIAPQFVQHTVETKDGETWSGLLTSQNKDGSVTLTLSDGRAIMIPASKIESHTTSKVSLMPEGLQQAMSPDDLQDLIAFLSTRK